jgi:hypothetical protein
LLNFFYTSPKVSAVFLRTVARSRGSFYGLSRLRQALFMVRVALRFSAGLNNGHKSIISCPAPVGLRRLMKSNQGVILLLSLIIENYRTCRASYQVEPELLGTYNWDIQL